MSDKRGDFRRSRAVYSCTLIALILALCGCGESPAPAVSEGELGAEEEPQGMLIELAKLQPLGTIITPDAKERVATVLVDLWIDRLPKNIEIVTRTPNGEASGRLGEQLLQRRRVRTFTIEDGKPVPGDLVFYRVVTAETE